MAIFNSYVKLPEGNTHIQRASNNPRPQPAEPNRQPGALAAHGQRRLPALSEAGRGGKIHGTDVPAMFH